MDLSCPKFEVRSSKFEVRAAERPELRIAGIREERCSQPAIRRQSPPVRAVLLVAPRVDRVDSDAVRNRQLLENVGQGLENCGGEDVFVFRRKRRGQRNFHNGCPTSNRRSRPASKFELMFYGRHSEQSIMTPTFVSIAPTHRSCPTRRGGQGRRSHQLHTTIEV